MAREPWSDEEDDFIREHPEMSPTELAVNLGRTHGTPEAYKKRRERLREQDKAVEALPVVRSSPPTSLKAILDDQPVLDGPDCCVISDLHIPFHDAGFIQNTVDLAVAWGVSDCLINGDLIDVEAFSKWIGDPENVFEEELEQCEQMLDYLSSHFKRVVWTLGNHERRFLGVAAKRQVRSSRFLRMITDAPNVEISSFEWSEINTPLGLWVACHPMNASVISARVPAIIASRRFTNAHVIGAHGHLRGQARTEDGKRWAIDSGCCLDTRRSAYSTKSVGTRPVMNQGAVILKGGYPFPVGPETPWNAYRRLYGKCEHEAAA